MSGRHAARDLSAVNDEYVSGFARRFGDFVRLVAVADEDSLVLLSLQPGVDMVGDSDEVESLHHRFVDTRRRPDRAVREDGVDVQIAFERLVALDVGNDDAMGNGGAGRQSDKHGCQQQIEVLSHL